MKYDIIVVGGGPGGAMAAKTAAEDGLKVVLVDSKREPTEFRRACLAAWYQKWLCPDGYLEPVTVEVNFDTYRFNWPKLGFSLDYDGPMMPYMNVIWISPSGYRAYPIKNEIVAFNVPNEIFLSGLLVSAEKAGAEVRLGTTAIEAENTADGVKVVVAGAAGVQTLEAKSAISADGFNSKIVESLGLNKKRGIVSQVDGIFSILEGVECTIPEHQYSWMHFDNPSLPGGSFGLGTVVGNTKFVFTNWKEFARLPKYASWFRHAQVISQKPWLATLRTSLRDPVAGNVVIIGDAAGAWDTWRQGAIACGYMAVKAIEKELAGKKGYPEYIEWWQKAFYYNEPGFYKRAALASGVFIKCTAEEIDYIYLIFEGQPVVPQLAIAKNPELVKKDRPELYEKLKNTIEQILASLEPALAVFPPEAEGSIFGDGGPEEYLSPWITYPGSD